MTNSQKTKKRIFILPTRHRDGRPLGIFLKRHPPLKKGDFKNNL